MNIGNIGNNIQQKKKANDIIYTPLLVAQLMIDMCDIQENENVLDPSKGKGVFYDNLPNKCIKSFCEITENKDFFDCHKKFDLIIGNPPFSMWDKWLEHTIKLTDKFCYIFGTLNFTQKRLKIVEDAGFGLTKLHLLKINGWFGTSLICIFEKGKPSIMTYTSKSFKCNTIP